MTKRLHILSAACAVVILASGSILARTDMTANMVDMWNLAEASGTATGAHAGIVLSENGGTIGTATVGGRAARDFEFDSTQYLSVADSAALSISADQAMTFAARFQLESYAATSMAILGRDDGGSNRDFLLYWTSSVGLRFVVFDSGNTGTEVVETSLSGLTLATPITVVAWHDPVANEIGISVNNNTPVLTSSYTAGTRGDSAAPFQVGSGVGAGVLPFDGPIGSVVYWKRVITSGERTEYYNSGSGVEYADIDAGGGVTPCSHKGTRILLGVGCHEAVP
jgi:hypothetical protein